METKKSARKYDTWEEGRYDTLKKKLLSLAWMHLKSLYGLMIVLSTVICQSRLKKPQRTTMWELKIPSWCWVTKGDRSHCHSTRSVPHKFLQLIKKNQHYLRRDGYGSMAKNIKCFLSHKKKKTPLKAHCQLKMYPKLDYYTHQGEIKPSDASVSSCCVPSTRSTRC